MQSWESEERIAFNIHGHDHNGIEREGHLNVAQNVYGYVPLNLNQFIKGGYLKQISSIHRTTINLATHKKLMKGITGK